MDRSALVIYLKNLRDLEVAKWQIRNLFSQEQADCENKNQKLRVTLYRNDFWETIDQGHPNSRSVQKVCCLMIVLLIPIWWMICFGAMVMTYQMESAHMLLYSMENSFSPILTGLLDFLAGIIALVLGTIAAASAYFLYGKGTVCSSKNVDMYNREVEKHNSEVNLHNQAEKMRQQENQQLIRKNQEQWRQKSRYLHLEYQKVYALLNKAYSLNILPNLYRNFSAVCYLYNRVSNSQDTLDEILVQEQTQTEIQQIRCRLNTIISLNQKWILENRCKEADADETIQILESCQQTEAGEANAVLYAQIASNYAEANAFFRLAYYLKS